MITARERFELVARKWFINEPALFAIYCTHDLTVNNKLSCVLRSGEGRIEYNEDSINLLSDPEMEQRLRTEMLRICLRHPYERQPTGCCQKALHMGSDMVLAPIYELPLMNLAQPEDFGLPMGQHFEWYADTLNDMMKSAVVVKDKDGDDSSDDNKDGDGNKTDGKDDGSQQGDSDRHDGQTDGKNGVDDQHKDDESEDAKSGGVQKKDSAEGKGAGVSNSGENEKDGKDKGGQPGSQDKQLQGGDDEYSGLWREDEERLESLKQVLQSIDQWGSVSQSMVDLIKKSLEGRIDYRKVLRAFHTSVISTNRSLTRMRPNRRLGFDAMGSKHDMSSRLLVAVDVSGSVSDSAIGKFFRIITNFFKYGVEAIDVIQFDASVIGEVMDLKAGSKNIKSNEFKIYGRGGTSFQCVVNYLKEHNNYDGLIFFTDGYAPVPVIDFKTRAKLLWVTENEKQYKDGKDWMTHLGRACFIH